MALITSDCAPCKVWWSWMGFLYSREDALPVAIGDPPVPGMSRGTQSQDTSAYKTTRVVC